MRAWLMVLIMGLTLSPAQGSDLEREARLAAEIEDSIVVGEPLYLTADGHDFLALYTAAEPARGSTLILHGRGYHPDWPLVAAPSVSYTHLRAHETAYTISFAGVCL